MHLLRLASRGFAVLFGLFLLIGSLANVAGLLPVSDPPMPTLPQRWLAALPLVLVGLALLAPHGRCLAQPRYGLLLGVNLLAGATCAYRALQTILLAQRGALDAVAIPLAIVIATIPLANAWGLWSLRRARMQAGA